MKYEAEETQKRQKDSKREKCPSCGKGFSNTKAMLFHYNICSRVYRKG